MYRGVTLIIFALCVAAAFPQTDAKMVAHLIPHSHCDPGWLDTFGQYYHRQVHKILDNVVKSLQQDESRRFVWAEISFFSVWFEQQPDEVREQVRKLAASGRLEFVEGGWVQADEATTHPDAIVQHITEGHDYLLRNVGVKPRIGWQIDPFGHSSLTPTLFARMGFDAMVINRIHFNIKAQLKTRRAMEFMWEPSATLADRARIYTHVLHTHYSAPKGFDFEESWSSVQVNSGNVRSRATLLSRELKSRQASYPSSHQLVTWGDDFKFQNSHIQWSNMDQLVKEINGNPDKYGVTLVYSTLSEYFDAVARENNPVPKITSDFFPYADNGDAYWTGYYTSRPLTKNVVRRTMAAVRSAEIFYALTRSTVTVPNGQWAEMYAKLQDGRRAIGLAQHHDGITGTSRKNVDDDYRNRMNSGREGAEQVLTYVSENLHRKPGSGDTMKAMRGPYEQVFDMTVGCCAEMSQNIVVMNSLSWSRKAAVTVLVKNDKHYITDFDGKIIPSQLDVAWEEDAGKQGARSETLRLTFIADLPPLGSSIYLLRKAKSGSESTMSKTTVYSKGSGGGLRGQTLSGAQNWGNVELKAENDFLTLEIDSKTGLAGHITNKRTGRRIFLSQDMLQYETRKSGSYIFRAPRPANSLGIDNKDKVVKYSDGPVYTEVRTEVAGFVFIYTVYKGAHVELGAIVDTQIKHVSVGPNKELVTRFQSALKTNGEFYTDNGQEWRRREYDGSKAIPANYYPMITSAALRAGKHMLTVMTSQSNGVTSLQDGMLEMMLHRQLMQDDGRGLSQPNHDTSVVDYHMAFMFNEADVGINLRPRLVLALNNPVTVRVESEKRNFDQIAAKFVPRFEPVHPQSLPEHTHVQLLAARHHDGRDVIFRLQNMYEVTQGFNTMSGLTDQIPVHSLFKNARVSGVRETTLSMTYSPKHQRLPFKDNGEILKLAYDPKTKVLQGNQNTEEEGVFLSDAAMAHKLLSMVSRDNPTPVTIDLKPLDFKAYYMTLTNTDEPIQAPIAAEHTVPVPTQQATQPTAAPATPTPATPVTTAPPAHTQAPATTQQTAAPTRNLNVNEAATPRFTIQPTTKVMRVVNPGNWHDDGSHFHAGQTEFVFILGLSLLGIGLMVLALYRLNGTGQRRTQLRSGTGKGD